MYYALFDGAQSHSSINHIVELAERNVTMKALGKLNESECTISIPWQTCWSYAVVDKAAVCWRPRRL